MNHHNPRVLGLCYDTCFTFIVNPQAGHETLVTTKSYLSHSAQTPRNRNNSFVKQIHSELLAGHVQPLVDIKQPEPARPGSVVGQLVHVHHLPGETLATRFGDSYHHWRGGNPRQYMG